MENVAHWTQQSTADFVYGISSTFVAQIETKMEKEEISRSDLANRLKKSNGRISQILNNPGNLGLKVMVETASSLGMKVSVIAYDDNDPNNENGPIDPDVFVQCWEHAGRPTNLFEIEDVSVYQNWEAYRTVGYSVNMSGYLEVLTAKPYPTTETVESINFGNFRIGAPQVSNLENWLRSFSSEVNESHGIWHQQKSFVIQENV